MKVTAHLTEQEADRILLNVVTNNHKIPVNKLTRNEDGSVDMTWVEPPPQPKRSGALMRLGSWIGRRRERFYAAGSAA